MPRAELTPALVGRWIELALENVVSEYPNKLDHVILAEDDWGAPRALHPLFFGSYDWHSAVHMHWLLVRLWGLKWDLPQSAAIQSYLDAHLTDARVAAECDYLERPASATFERTYGWAWLLKLCGELEGLAKTDSRARRWLAALDPLARRFTERFQAYLPFADYPIRAGTHANSAFGMLFAFEYGLRKGNRLLVDLIKRRALAWFKDDTRYPAQYEPSGSDFLSPGLVEAVLMRELLGDGAFVDWWRRFEPDSKSLESWLTPVSVADRADAQVVHLDGLNLSRAWCWSRLVGALPRAQAEVVQNAMDAHLNRSLPHAAQGHYVGTHWLASFALLALSE
ncbi:MAG: DUF2891 domain-containing protein [Burkholderiaceae bacterium]|jgi:hypothetical protein